MISKDPPKYYVLLQQPMLISDYFLGIFIQRG